MIIKKPFPDPALPIYEESYPVFSFLIDPLKRISIPAVFGLLSDAAGRDATLRGWGYESLIHKNQAWVLIRARMEIDRQPHWGETIILKTWPKLMKGVIAMRDFQIMDANRNILMAGSTAWTMMDLASRRPVRLIGDHYDTGELAHYDALSVQPEKIAWPDNQNIVSEMQVKFGSLDMNGHVNNPRYIEWVMNEIPSDILMNRQLASIDVNFISEVRFGEEIQIVMNEDSGDLTIFNGYIINKADQHPAFAARFIFAS